MTDYAALLRGITPMNATMAGLREAFTRAGFADVRTVLGSGNVVFRAPAASDATIERKAEAAMTKHLGHAFFTIVRRVDALRDLLASDPYRAFRLKPGSKRVVTFLRRPTDVTLDLPVELHGARILALKGTELFTAYVATPKGPVFMSLIERTLGKDVTTRTWDTIAKIAR